MARTDVDFYLRSHQIAYLRQISRNREISLADALGAVIDATTLQCAAASVRTAYKARFHTMLSTEHLTLIDRQALQLGLVRSDVVRRLIDEAMAGALVV